MSDIQRARPTFFHSMPRLWLKFRDGVHGKISARRLRMLLRVPLLRRLVARNVMRGLGLDQARFAITGSAPTPPELIAWYRALGLELLEGYGMTENLALSHITPMGKLRAGRVGRLAPDVEGRIGIDGEVQVKSPGVMRGYYRDPELTAETFTPDGFLRTGDLGEVDAEGYLKITGRCKELFKTSKGKFVAPSPIENLLNTSGVVEQSCVMGVGEPQPFAVVMLAESVRKALATSGDRSDVEAPLKQLLATVNAKLPEWERLAFLAVTAKEWTIAEGLLTPTLKIKRSAIEARYGHVIAQRGEAGARVVWIAEAGLGISVAG